MDTTSTLTPIQQEVLAFVRESIQKRRRPPTVREIMLHFGWSSPQSARKHLLALEAKGFLQREEHTARGLQPADPPLEGIAVPLLGRVAAGLPLLAEENREGTLTVDASLARGRRSLFALTVKGDSMIDAHILPGDKVIVQQTSHADPGDVVVALVDGEATVKTFRKKGNTVFLEAANPKYDPIVISTGQDFRILGKVIGVFSPR